MLQNYVSSKPEPKLLPAGRNVVRLASYLECNGNDDVRYDHSNGRIAIVGIKDKQYKWATPAKMLAVHLIGKDNTSTVHKLSFQEFKKYANLSDEEKASGKFTEESGYACTMINGKLDRILIPDEQSSCGARINGFLFAVTGGVEGMPGQDALEYSIATKVEFGCNVLHQPWTDPATKITTMQCVVTSVFPLKNGGESDPVKKALEIPADMQA